MNKTTFFLLIITLQLSNAFPQSWLQQNVAMQAPDSRPQKISIVNANVAWCITNIFSSVKEFSRTTDGGNTWTAGLIAPIDSNAQLTGISAIDSLTAYVCFFVPYYGGHIYKTINGGLTWNPSGAGTVFLDSLSYPNEIYFWDAANGFAFGDPIDSVYEIYLTSDSGSTWVQVSSSNIPTSINGTVTTYSPLVVMDSTIWFPSFSGHLFKSTDKGQTWTKTKIDTTVHIYGLSFLDDKLHGIAISSNYNTYLTADGGNSWNLISPIGTGPWYTIRSIPGTSYFVSVTEITGHSSYSSDMGNSWTTIDSLTPYYGLAFKDINTGYSGGDLQSPTLGGIYKWNAGALGISENKIIQQFSVYPNPASSFVKFSMFLTEFKSISIKIYDLTGKEIKTIVNEKVNAGEHTYTWNIANEKNGHVITGIYIIKVDAEGYTLSKKFTIIK
jgi:photosystem II stability/assembly factor-like uncharacterized protein